MSPQRRTATPARGPLRGRIRVPGDKSIAHRAILFNALARGEATVEGLPSGADVRSTIAVCRALGCEIDELSPGSVRVKGTSMSFATPRGALDCGNSGTTMRLVMGALAGAGVDAVLDGDESLRRRPMERVAAPLREMGADIATHDGCAPVTVRPASLVGRRIALSVASAQLKSALLLAGLSARGETTVVEPEPTRDHSERMLAAMGVGLRSEGEAVSLTGPVVPEAVDVTVPGDPSSAAFFAVAAALVPDSDVCVERVCLNPGRTGFVEVLRRMGADVRVAETGSVGGEPVGEIRVRASALRGTVVEGEEIPGCVDEIPVLAVAAAFAEGDTEIRGAAELRVKESDRLAMIAAMLGVFGREVEERADGLTIHGAGTSALAGGGEVETGGDHRIAMSAFVAALAADRDVGVRRADSAGISFPEFFDRLEELQK